MKLMAINDQMEMAFSGPALRVDPVSGNEVPPGSLPEEVRDDIDVNLSEGEYVVPADVLRFHGVKFFEDLRAEAKIGLAGMESAGRIGGQPVDSAPMDPAAMGISEEDIAMLEQALAGEGVPEAAMAEGGLMDKVAFAAMNDPLVNERINSKGMAVGFAAGGMTQSLYNDPTKIDSLIDQVMTAAQTNPSLLEQLSKRGISINTTQADMQPTEMKQANTQPIELSHGGPVHAPTPTFNPMDYGLGFSTFGPMSPGGGPQVFKDKNGIIHATKALMDAANAAIDAAAAGGYGTSSGTGSKGLGSGTGRNSVAVGESYTTPSGETKTRMPDSYYAGGGDADQKRALKKLGETDPNAWMGKHDYSDPDILRTQTLAALNKEQGIISSTLGAAPFGQAFQAAQGSEYQTNMEILRGSGTEEENEEIDTAFKKWKESRLGTQPNGIITAILNNTRGEETAAALLSGNQNHWSAKAKFDSKPDAAGNITVNPRTGKTITGKVTSPGSTRGKSSVEKAEQKAGEARQEKARQERNKKASKEAGKSSTNEAGQINTEKFLKDFKGGVGGRAKGGLMTKNKK